MPSLYISHSSALAFWRTNPPWYVMEGTERDIRSIRDCAQTVEEFNSFSVPESEFGPDPVDVLVPVDAPRCPDRFRRHEQRRRLPRHALCPVGDGVFVVAPELCLVQMCQTLSFIEALELGMEFCGTYALRSTDAEGKAERISPLVDAGAFRRHVEAWRGLHGLPIARRIARFLMPGSNSPMETKLYMMLCLPLMYGGYNLGRPELNPTFDLTAEEMEILRVTKDKPDLLWRDKGLIIEYDGEYHDETNQRISDALRQTVLEGRNYTVLRVNRFQVYNPLAFDTFATSLAKRLGVRRRPESAKHRLAREGLREVLLE